MSTRPDPEYPLWSQMPEPPVASVVENAAGRTFMRANAGWFLEGRAPGHRDYYSWAELCLEHAPFRLFQLPTVDPSIDPDCADLAPPATLPGRLHTVEEAIYATLVRITAPESVGVSLRATAGLLAGTIASLVGVPEDRPASEGVAPELRPEPEWLTSLRNDMRAELSNLRLATVETYTDRAVGVAASYLHPLYRDLANLREDYEGSETRVAGLAENDKRVNALKAQVARREATISAYETALTESHARIEELEREQVGREPDGPALQYLPLSEVTDGHVDAYLKATSRAMERNGLNGTPVLTDHDVIRAGLAAIQWPSQAIEAAPEMREVPWTLLREGDTVTATWVKDEPMGADTAAFRIAGDGAGWLRDPVVTRPVSQLPTSGQVAYEAARTERLARRRSDEVIGWDELNDGIRGMWEAAATAVLAGQTNDGLEG